MKHEQVTVLVTVRYRTWGYIVVQLVKALHYNLEGSGFNS